MNKNEEITKEPEIDNPGHQIQNDKGERWLCEAVNVVIEHLDKFGACVIDDFLGETKGMKILSEVLQLQQLQIFQVIIYFQWQGVQKKNFLEKTKS